MVCKATFTKNLRSAQSLASTLVGLALVSLLFAALATVYLYSARSFLGMGNYLEMDSNARLAVDTITSDIRQADYLTVFSSNSLSLQMGTNQLTYSLNIPHRALIRTFASRSKALLGDCDDVRFEIFARNPTNFSFDYFPTTGAPTNCKLVDVTVVCTRSILGTKANSTTIQSAKIVIRKQK